MVPSSFTRKFLILLAFVVCVFYLAFRAIYTFNDTGPYAWTVSILLYVAECFGIFNLFLFFLQVWEVEEPPVQPVLEGRSVDIFVPTYNEDVSLLRATVEACVRMDYKHKTYVLDDGQRPEVAALAKELNVEYISRPDNRHFKAGNLNHAFERTDGEFVVVLDADVSRLHSKPVQRNTRRRSKGARNASRHSRPQLSVDHRRPRVGRG